MKGHVLTGTGGTKREAVEERLLARFPSMKIFEPSKHFPDMVRFQDGSFGFSYGAFALYAHGFNPRGMSRIAPFGLIYSEADAMFGLGYFRKERDCESDDGYLMVISPKGPGAVRRVSEIADEVLRNTSLPCKGVYVRFLDGFDRRKFIEVGFDEVTATSNPWHVGAPLEDETFCHSTLWLPSVLRLINQNSNWFDVLDLAGAEDKEHRRKSKMGFRRFENFLKRNSLSFEMRRIAFGAGQEPKVAVEVKMAHGVIRAHFASLANPIGSCVEDYLGIVSLETLKLMDTIGYIGYLNGVPISIFLGVPLQGCGQRKSLGLYTSITLRNAEQVLGSLLGLDPYEMIDNLSGLGDGRQKVPRVEGFSAIALFNQLHYFARVLAHDIPIIKLGGSEEKKLDDAKRQLGAVEDKSYWVFKGKCEC